MGYFEMFCFLLLLQHIQRQQVTGKTRQGKSMPLAVLIRHSEEMKNSEAANKAFFPDGHPVFEHESHLHVVVWIYCNLSGLITVTQSGLIHSCDTALSRLFFGYEREELIGKVSR